MKNIFFFPFLILGFVSSTFAGTADKAAHTAKTNLPLIQKMAADPAVLTDVKAQNIQNMTAEHAKSIQADWEKIGISETVKPYLNKPSVAVMKKAMAQNPLLIKCFILDNKGYIVSTNPKSRDFIHGTEDKFVKSFNGGSGKTWVGPAMLDVSTKIYSVQVGVPVKDGNQTIGILIATLSLE